MEKKAVLVFSVAAIVVIFAGIALAQGRSRLSDNDFRGMTGPERNGMMNSGMISGMDTIHSQMHPIITSGTYEDLANLRDRIGYNIMPWIQNEQDFKQMQQAHQKMAEHYERKGVNLSKGCQMMQYDDDDY